ncbi:MAG: class I SAM-dependent methyltransferase [Bacillota bacterium]
MLEIFKQIPLYRFLAYCNDLSLEKVVLDCGAGGETPPLSLFFEYDYRTIGIESDNEQLQIAENYAKSKGQDLNIMKGDMRQLPFENNSISFVYSYNSVFHMTKAEVEKSINEMKRVLVPGGLFFVNFLTTKDFRCGEGPSLGNNQFEQYDDDIPVIHSYYAENEPETLFNDMFILYKEDRVLERIYQGEKIRQGFIDYILRK